MNTWSLVKFGFFINKLQNKKISLNLVVSKGENIYIYILKNRYTYT